MKSCFKIPRILIPRENFSLWAVPAGDRMPADRGLWERVEHTVGDSPSALRFLLPQTCGEASGEDVQEIRSRMYAALEDGTLEKLNRGAVFTERTFPDGTVRQGIVAAFDLEQYSDEAGEKALFRPAAKSADPARDLSVRRACPLEFSPALVYFRDKKGRVMQVRTDDLELLYDFELMEQGGTLKGYYLPDDLAAEMLGDISLRGTAFIVAEGVDFVAAAKRHWEQLKTTLPADCLASQPARFVLAEFVDLTAQPARAPMGRYLSCGDDAALIAALSKAIKVKRDGSLLLSVRTGADVIEKADAVLLRLMREKGGDVQYFSRRADLKRALSAGGVGICFDPFTDDDWFDAVSGGAYLPAHCFPSDGASRYLLEGREIAYD